MELPRLPAGYGFSCVAKVKPGWEEHLYKNAKVMEKAIKDRSGYARYTQGRRTTRQSSGHSQVSPRTPMAETNP